MTTSNGNGFVKLPVRVFEWLVLGLLATGGGYAGSATADETAELRADFRGLEVEIRASQRRPQATSLRTFPSSWASSSTTRSISTS